MAAFGFYKDGAPSGAHSINHSDYHYYNKIIIRTYDIDKTSIICPN